MILMWTFFFPSPPLQRTVLTLHNQPRCLSQRKAIYIEEKLSFTLQAGYKITLNRLV